MARKDTIFISYRRKDSGGHALAIYRELSRRFGNDAIFFDINNIEAGETFPDVLTSAVIGCEVLLALIGPDWLEIKNQKGERRLDDVNDFVRQEITLALVNNKLVIPVLIGDSSCPSAESLPSPLKELPNKNAVKWGGAIYEYNAQLEHLVEQIRKKGISECHRTGRPVPAEWVPSSYIERSDVTDELLTALCDRGSAESGRIDSLAIHGLGGIGKTTIAAWLAWHPVTVDRFTDGCLWVRLGREGNVDALTVITDWLTRLDTAGEKPTTIEAAKNNFTDTLQEKDVLIVIDDIWPETFSIARKLMVPSSPRCRYLLTTRMRGLATELDAHLFPIDALSSDQSLALLASKLRRELSETERVLAQNLADAKDGHPLALEQAAGQISKGKSWDELLDDHKDKISRLEALGKPSSRVRRHLEPDEAKYSVKASLLLSVEGLSDAARHLFALFGVLAEGSEIAPVCAATLWSMDRGKAHDYLNDFAEEGIIQRRDNAYRLHSLMHDLAFYMLTSPATPPHLDDIPGLGLTLEQASRELLSRYRTQTCDGLWHTLQDDGYILDHLVWQFQKAGWPEEIEKLFWEEANDGRCGWLDARERQLRESGFLADILYAQRLAKDELTRAINDEARTAALRQYIHYTLIHASFISQADRIHGFLVGAALEHKVIPWQRALALAQARPEGSCLPGQESRADLLLGIAHFAPEEQRAAILEEANRLQRTKPKKSIIQAPADREEKAEATESDTVDTAKKKINDLITCLATLSPDQQTQAIEAALVYADSIPEYDFRAEALLKIAKVMPDAERPPVLQQALALLKDTLEGRKSAQVQKNASGQYLGHDLLNPTWREALLLEIQVMLKGDWQSILERILQRARSDSDPYIRGFIIWYTCRLIPDEALVRSIIKEELDAELVVGDQSLVNQTLLYGMGLVPLDVAVVIAEFIARTGATARPRSFFDTGMETTQFHTWRPQQSAQAWLCVAHQSPEPQRAERFAFALAASRSIVSLEVRANNLKETALLMNPDERLEILEEAVSTALRIDDPLRRAPLIASLADALPPKRQCEVLDEVLRDARAQQGYQRALALAYVAQYLPEAKQFDANGDSSHSSSFSVRSASRSSRSQRLTTRSKKLDIIQSRLGKKSSVEANPLSKDERLAVILEAFKVVEESEYSKSPELGVRIRAAAARALSGDNRQVALDQALEAVKYVQGIPFFDRWSLYVRLVAPLEDEEKRTPKLLAMLPHPEYIPAEYRMDFTLNVISLLPLEEALNAARSIVNDPYLRALALSMLAPRFALMATPESAVCLWKEIMELMLGHKRAELVHCISNGCGPLISAIGDSSSPTSLVRSLMVVARWWP